MNRIKHSQMLMSYINNLGDFDIADEIDGNYNHMAATIIDGMLQPGLNYSTVVKPRIHNILHKFPSSTTLSDFDKIIHQYKLSELLKFRGKKVTNIISLVNFLKTQNIETEEDFKSWLLHPQNESKLKFQKGISDKTCDYFKILVGISTVAIDRHLFDFLKEAQIHVTDYTEAKNIIEATAEKLSIDAAYLDHSIWKYKSRKNNAKSKKILDSAEKLNKKRFAIVSEYREIQFRPYSKWCEVLPDHNIKVSLHFGNEWVRCNIGNKSKQIWTKKTNETSLGNITWTEFFRKTGIHEKQRFKVQLMDEIFTFAFNKSPC